MFLLEFGKTPNIKKNKDGGGLARERELLHSFIKLSIWLCLPLPAGCSPLLLGKMIFNTNWYACAMANLASPLLRAIQALPIILIAIDKAPLSILFISLQT